MTQQSQLSNDDIRGLVMNFVLGGEVTGLPFRATKEEVKAVLQAYFVSRFAELGITLTIAGE